MSTTHPPTAEWLSPDELAEWLGVPVRSIYSWLHEAPPLVRTRSGDIAAFAALTSRRGSRTAPTTPRLRHDPTAKPPRWERGGRCPRQQTVTGVPPPATEAAYAAAAVVLILDVERRTCPLCGSHGLCEPLTAAFRDACDTIIASRDRRAVAA